MKIIIGLVILVFIGMIWCCLKVASDVDDENEQIMRKRHKKEDCE